MSKKLFVGNLSWGISSERLQEIFSEYGDVSDAVVIKNERGQSKGFGFVTFENDADADKAIEALNEKELDGRNVVVNEARPPRERSDRY